MSPKIQIYSVQARAGLIESHAEHYHYRVPFRFWATSRGRRPRLCLSTQQHPEQVIRATPQQCAGGDFPRLSRKPVLRHKLSRNMAGLPSGNARARARMGIPTLPANSRRKTSALPLPQAQRRVAVFLCFSLYGRVCAGVPMNPPRRHQATYGDMKTDLVLSEGSFCFLLLFSFYYSHPSLFRLPSESPFWYVS